MATSVALILVCSVFILLIHRGKYSPSLAPTQRRGREYLEVGILVVCLLTIPFIKFNLLWFSGWLSALLKYSTSFSIRNPAAAGKNSATPAVEACALCAVPKASFTKISPKDANFLENSLLFSSSSG